MATRKQSTLQKRDEFIDGENHKYQHQPAVSNGLKIKIDHLRTFEPLSDNQKLFFEMYRGGGYFIGLFGSPGVGKCQGENVEVNLLVPDDVYEKLKNMS